MDRLRSVNTQWWTSDSAHSILRERRALTNTRHTEEYRIGRGTFDQKDNRASPAFLPAVQQDLIILTLEILARDPVADAATSKREAFRHTCREFVQVAFTQALEQVEAQTRAETPVLRAQIRTRAEDSFEMTRRALGPVLQSLLPQIVEMPTLRNGISPLQMPVPQIVSATVSPDDMPVRANAEPAQSSLPLPIEATLPLQYSASSSPMSREATAGELGYPPV
ncbi:hypothetical protein EDB86DRAFT_643019 [Lactarius hatsudake]|nr:hypothetical protein EDB86DRAFT_643019 [Lactarius hatsudake]